MLVVQNIAQFTSCTKSTSDRPESIVQSWAVSNKMAKWPLAQGLRRMQIN